MATLANILGALGGVAPINNSDPLGLGDATRWVNPYNPGAAQPSPNFLQQALSGGESAPQNTAPVPQQPEPAPRQRRSVLDMIGGISDVIAGVGGANPMYQPTLDAREDRQRAIDLDALRKTQAEQQIRAGNLDIENDVRTRMGQALGSIAGNPEALQMWPQIAEAAGIPADQAAQIGGLLQQRPEMAGALATSFGFTPQRPGSMAKEVQIYSLLQRESPEMAATYLKSLTDPDGLTPYQAATLGISMQRLGLDQEKFEFQKSKPTDPKAAAAAEQRVSIAQSAQPIVDSIRETVGRLAAAGSMNAPGQTGQQRIGAAAYETVPLLERVTNPEGFSARQDLNRLLTTGIPALLPLLGGLTIGGKNIDAAKELDTWRNAIASAKDYNSAIRATNDMQARIDEILNSADQFKTPAQGTPQSGRRIMPRASRGNSRQNAAPTVSNW